jgi:glycosyltransferase involved in cell wall biosynthesis
VSDLLVVTTVPVTLKAFLTPFADHFRSKGWRVDAMAAGVSESPVAESFDEVHDIEWSRNPFDPRSLRRATPRVREVVAAGGYDIVHVHTPVAAFTTRYALRNEDSARVVYTAHGFHFSPELPASRNAPFLALERLAGRWTDELVVINDDDLAAARKHAIVPEDRVRLMHGIGVDTDLFSPTSVSAGTVDETRRGLGLDDQPLFLMIAEFIPRKRHAEVVQAFAKTRPAAQLAFAGEGPTFDEVKALAEELGVSDRVHFLGFRRDIKELLAASTATVLFSAHEGLPRSSMESLAMGVPVIGSDIRGVRDLLADGCGVLVPPGDIEALATAFDEMAEDPDRAKQMGRLGHEKMQGDYSLPAVIAEHERLYADVLESPAR